MKVPLKQIEDELLYEWELFHGVDTIDWFECYQIYLPYWVGYMPKHLRQLYVDEIYKHNDFKENGLWKC